MDRKKIRIGIFASSHSLIDRVQALAAKQPDQIFINTHGLDDAIPPALEMVRNGVEVIISRRGTAHLLRENLRIPVLSFPHRSLDILTSLTQAKEEGNKILLPVFRHKLGGFEILEDLLHITLVQHIYTDKAGLIQAVARGRDEGCDVVVGGNVTQQSAEALGLKFVEIRTSEEDITATIENAKSVTIAARDQKAAALRYHAIIDAASDGLIAVNESGRITAINETAAALLKLDKAATLGSHFAQVIPQAPISQVLTTKKPITEIPSPLRGEG
jgi:transcriptional regulator with PAS, ATPase and Fis domain